MDAKAAANWLNNEILGRLNRDGLSITDVPVTAAANNAIIQMISDQTISGKIAKDRPSPPGANDPDPNLGSVPSRPPPPNREEMKRITEGLVADRANAQYSNAATPIPDPSSPSASPASSTSPRTSDSAPTTSTSTGSTRPRSRSSSRSARPRASSCS